MARLPAAGRVTLSGCLGAAGTALALGRTIRPVRQGLLRALGGIALSCTGIVNTAWDLCDIE